MHYDTPQAAGSQCPLHWQLSQNAAMCGANLVEFSCSNFKVAITRTHAGAPLDLLVNSCMCGIDVDLVLLQTVAFREAYFSKIDKDIGTVYTLVIDLKKQKNEKESRR